MAQPDSLQSLTVAELKIRLKDAGLAVSGKKAELIARLEEKKVLAEPRSVVQSNDKVAKPAKKSTDGKLPFFLAIKEDGIGSVEIDKWKAASYGMAFFMLIMLIIGLNSMSWYSASMEETGDGWFGPMEMEVSVGLGEMEMSYSGLMEMKMNVPLSECYEEEGGDDGEDDEVDDEEGGEVSCSSLATAGTINKIFIILSLVSIIVLLIFSIGRGFGVFSSGVLDEKSDLIEKWSWLVAVVSINLGTLLYGMIVGFQSHFGEPYEESLGSMWWMMFLFSLIFAAIVYNEKTMAMIDSLKNKFDGWNANN